MILKEGIVRKERKEEEKSPAPGENQTQDLMIKRRVFDRCATTAAPFFGHKIAFLSRKRPFYFKLNYSERCSRVVRKRKKIRWWLVRAWLQTHNILLQSVFMAPTMKWKWRCLPPLLQFCLMLLRRQKWLKIKKSNCFCFAVDAVAQSVKLLELRSRKSGATELTWFDSQLRYRS